MPLINYDLVLSLRSMFSFEFLSFGFTFKATFTLLRQYTAKGKMILGNIITDIVKMIFKELQKYCLLRSQAK